MRTLLKFRCERCHALFDAEGTREEWVSPIYGPCWEYKASCPSCAAPAKEHRPKARHRSDSESLGGSGPCGEGACESGGGPYGGDQDFGE